jgi:hypothetical protein
MLARKRQGQLLWYAVQLRGVGKGPRGRLLSILLCGVVGTLPVVSEQMYSYCGEVLTALLGTPIFMLLQATWLLLVGNRVEQGFVRCVA